MNHWPRVAFFADVLGGADGVGMTCQNILAAARRRGLPFLVIHPAERNSHQRSSPLEALELIRGPFAIRLDRYLRFDLLFARHYRRALSAVRAFRAAVVHITGPGDLGIIGACVARALGLPLVASWHTNFHEFAAKRLWKLASPLPAKMRRGLTSLTENCVLRAVLRFYRMASVTLAPNEEQRLLIGSATKKPVFCMGRGVDTDLFSPAKRKVDDGIFRLGYVGRLRPEKNLGLLAEIEDSLRRGGAGSYRFLIVGEGSERAWLQRRLRRADFAGELFGEALAQAYADMDLFVFPSETDTYGNVILEAMASGTPAVVTFHGGPKYLVQDGVTGFVAADKEDFLAKVRSVMVSPRLLSPMRRACRSAAGRKTWDGVLDDLHRAYTACEAHPAGA